MNIDIKESNSRFLALIICIILFSGLIYIGQIIFQNSSSKGKMISLIAIYFFAFLLMIFTILPLLTPIVRNYRIRDDYLNQIRINQELINIKLAKELKGKPNKEMYSNSVKNLMGIEIKKRKNLWKK